MAKRSKNPVLVNAAEMHRQHPDTFNIPTSEEIDSLHAGDIVKVCNDYERFWVQLEARNKERLSGRVDSMLLISGLSFGDKIEFCTDNIYEVYRKN